MRHGGKACPGCGVMYVQGLSHPETDWNNMPWFLDRLRGTSKEGHTVWRQMPAWTMLVLDKWSWEEGARG